MTSNVDETMEVINLNVLVKRIIEELYFPHNVKIKIRSELPTLLIDRNKMNSLFTNLLNNAVVALENVTMGIVEIDYKQKEGELLFSISDNGCGISAIQQKEILNMFEELDSDVSSNGLGLTLVKRIINFYEGDIWLSSRVKKGTTVFFTLKNVQNGNA